MKALLDTGATGYSFIDDRAAHILCNHLQISFIPLSRPRLLKAYDGRPAEPITHAIYPTFTVQNLVEHTTPMLVTRLGNHPIILGKPWMNRHGVYLDILLDELVYMPGRTQKLADIAAQLNGIGLPTPPSTPQTEIVPTRKTSKPKQYQILERPVESLSEEDTTSAEKKKKIRRIVPTATPSLELAGLGEEKLDIAPIGAAVY